MAQLKSTTVMGNLSVTGNALASKLIKTGGTSDDILMGDGSTTSKQGLIDSLEAAMGGNSWRPVKYGTTTLSDTTTTLEFAAGTNIGLDFTGGKLTITGTYALTKEAIVAALGYTPPTEDTNTDTKVTQTVTTTANTSKRPVILGQSYSDAATPSFSTVTDTVMASHNIYVAPEEGYLYAQKLYSGGTEVLTSHQSLADYVKGPAGANDGELALFSGTTGKLIRGQAGVRVITGSIINAMGFSMDETATFQYNSSTDCVELVWS